MYFDSIFVTFKRGKLCFQRFIWNWYNYFFNSLFYIGVQPINNVVIVSGAQQSNSAIHIHVSMELITILKREEIIAAARMVVTSRARKEAIIEKGVLMFLSFTQIIVAQLCALNNLLNFINKFFSFMCVSCHF